MDLGFNRILIYEGLYRYVNNQWECFVDCITRYEYPDFIRDNRYLYNRHAQYLRQYVPPYYWAGIWYWGVNNQWVLAQQDSNYLGD